MTRDVNVFTIQQISQILGIPRSTLRYWEKAVAEIRPDRTDGGQRRYTDDHIQLFRRVVELKGQGMGLAQIQRTLAPTDESASDHLSTSQFERLAERIVQTVRQEIRTYLHGLDAERRDKGVRQEK